MAVSYPSKVLTILDVPEVRRFKAKFKYNFFVPDEKSNESGSRKAFGTTTEDQVDELRRKVPRFVEFSFEPVDVRSNASVDNEFVTDLSRPQGIKRIIEDANKKYKVQNETDVATRGYSALNLQDDKVDVKSRNLILHSSQVRAFSNNETVVSSTPTDIAKLLNDVTSKWIQGKWILKLLSTMNYGEVTYYDTSTRKNRRRQPTWVRQIADLNHYSQFSDKFLSTILHQSVMNPLCPFSGELSLHREAAQTAQAMARTLDSAGKISDYEYFTNLKPISIERIDASEFKNAVKVIGYVIDKWEILPSGYKRSRDPIILSSSSIGGGLDSKIKYDVSYSYSIRAIALIQFQAVDEETGQIFAITGLISSRKSPASGVYCKEYDPPPPPGDIDFIWDYRNKKMTMMWSFPVVSTRDIKRFQVFRRQSIYEPFQLLAEYDFDDSEIPDPRKETPTATRVYQMENPLTTYMDEEFTKDTKYIYALCSVDAHDFTSNYSQQFAVSFSELENRIVKEIISPEGAPKPYPNFYLIANPDLGVDSISLTSDAIKDSGHTKGAIFFDPEYLSIVDSNEEDLGLLSFSDQDEEGRYKLQVINVDRQKSQVINIDLKDLRTSK